MKQPLFSYPLRFLIPDFFLKHRRVLLRNDSVRWDKTVSTENRETRPYLIPNFFRYQKFSKTQNSFSTNCSVVWDRKLLTEIVSILPPPTHLSIKSFDTTFFLKHRRFLLRCFSILWDINFSTESCDVPRFFNLQNFSMPEIFRNIERTMYKFFRHCETKAF